MVRCKPLPLYCPSGAWPSSAPKRRSRGPLAPSRRPSPTAVIRHFCFSPVGFSADYEEQSLRSEWRDGAEIACWTRVSRWRRQQRPNHADILPKPRHSGPKTHRRCTTAANAVVSICESILQLDPEAHTMMAKNAAGRARADISTKTVRCCWGAFRCRDRVTTQIALERREESCAKLTGKHPGNGGSSCQSGEFHARRASAPVQVPRRLPVGSVTSRACHSGCIATRLCRKSNRNGFSKARSGISLPRGRDSQSRRLAYDCCRADAGGGRPRQ